LTAGLPVRAWRAPRFLLLPVLLFAFWQACAWLDWLPQGIVPSPQAVARAWYTWIVGGPARSLSPYSGTWVGATLHSGQRVLEGFLTAALIGVPLGLMIGWNRLTAAYIDPTIQLFRPIPITAWIPFALAFFGIYDASAIFLVALGAFFPIVINTTHGARHTDPLLLRAARMLGARPAVELRCIVFPSALPSIFTGLRLGVGVSWTAVIISEMVAVKSGLGYALWDAYYVGRMDICVATMISFGLLGFLSDRLVMLVWRVSEPWRRHGGET
jgi:NitT/TauT family transport system permease protein